MSQGRFDRLQELFLEATDLPPTERDTFLERECAGDASLLAEIRALLAEDVQQESLLDQGLGRVAERLVRDAPDEILSGKEFGPYRITRRIGEGGMAVVYLAERPDLGHEVAIKVLRDAAISPSRRERFASEQRTLAQLNHASIAQLHDADTLADGTPWFAMEYVEGIPLTEYCSTHRTTLEGRLLLIRAVCEAVQHAHRHLVIHRDLKPSNILVRADGTVKLLDFGIAKQLETDETPVDQTKTGLRLMTPAYAAPEQLRGERVGIHTDVYALGVILYELLAGRLPFDFADRSPAEIDRLITEQEPERPSVVARRMERRQGSDASWGDLDVLCLTAMHKDPQRRYPTVDALIRDIDHFLAREPLEARPDTFGYRTGKFIRRNRQAVVAATVVFVVLTAMVTFYTVRLATARNAALAEATRTERIQRFMTNLFEGGDEQVGPADSLRVVSLLDRGVLEAAALVTEPAVQAELYVTLGGIYQKLGQLARADTLLQLALAQRRTLYGDDHVEVGESEVALGGLRMDQAAFEEAETLIRSGLERLRRHRPADHPSIARAMTALGTALEEQGEYDRAILQLEEALRLQEAAGPNPNPDLTSTLTELGNTHFYSGNYPTADSNFRRALTLDRELYGDRHPLVANDLINVGAVLHEQGNYTESEPYYRQALALNRGFYGEEHSKVAENLTMLGRSLVYQRRLVEADSVLRRAVAILQRVYGEVHPLVASSLNEVGNTAVLQDRPDEAERIFERVARIYRQVYPESHYVVGIAVSNLASVQLNRARYAEAARGFEEAITIFAATQGPNHTNTGIARIKLGRALLRQRRWAAAAAASLAGYEILKPQMDSGVSWLVAARKDLVAAYDSLGQSERGQPFRAELAGPSEK
jgi:serine/threonine-protein kinase